ncbi:uncharacterized protein PHALS_08762 [Plasmopara halstedii]|uniref:Uncharacterized protein n=1 Tax=Plasmopara halstedii TaxID=4781 RepID=A0A0P1ADN0_PLAHL|nr:uncharacterized protein PHALS_08762 [Plasmopara halstedii]CEG38703.1 hypothetical protein PHALS_08762 [Plasmopara halstedii]|eukprot:XP_024575072.1 hypothetical protein PHALS_08762 [Plasmopara halstedii]
MRTNFSTQTVAKFYGIVPVDNPLLRIHIARPFNIQLLNVQQGSTCTCSSLHRQAMEVVQVHFGSAILRMLGWLNLAILFQRRCHPALSNEGPGFTCKWVPSRLARWRL